ncbi:probable phosphatase PSR2 [Selaginella moellendorffii]|uniref:probable phosphatase PSR2 n=1 Tax=Selaginella moellendorffii TaxID=88036 RepID=UPI000D1C7355|nr:probable phosphatase PSR2 [Selaginella moellendorffii]|eukprot:XP_024523051.1 probable phosphatase PSR2 [Selaginella moellendorffii]
MKKTLILDLDNTLVYAHKDLVSSVDFSMEFDDDAPLHIMKRPGVDEFLGKVSKVYDIVVFSAAQEKYVNLVVDHLDPTGGLVSRRLHGGNCVVLKDGTKVKNLDHVGFRDFKRVVALDDIVDFYQGHQESVVVAPKFEGSKDDHFLADVTPFLLALSKCVDFTKVIHRWNIGQCVEKQGKLYVLDPFDDEWVVFN